MLVIDYFEKDTAIIKNGNDSIFMERHLLPHGAREGDVLRLYPQGVDCENAVALYIVPGENDSSLVFRMSEAGEMHNSLFDAEDSTIMCLSIDSQATIKRREAIREFEHEYDQKID